MTHFYFGDPTKEFSLQLVKTLVDSEADILEIGIPYSDPVCDGDVFQRTCRRALEAGITPNDVFIGIKKLRSDSGQARMTKVHIYLTSYYAPIFKMGVREFVQRAKNVGVKGLIIPDLLLEEQIELRNDCDNNGLSLIQFATVYSSEERLKQIIDASTNFIYCVSLPGVTGDKREVTQLRQLLQVLKKMTNKKLFVGFGINSANDVKNIMAMEADGVIVGSAIARIYEEHLNTPEKSLVKIGEFVKGLKKSTIE